MAPTTPPKLEQVVFVFKFTDRLSKIAPGTK
jgi:hypothetical protein